MSTAAMVLGWVVIGLVALAVAVTVISTVLAFLWEGVIWGGRLTETDFAQLEQKFEREYHLFGFQLFKVFIGFICVSERLKKASDE